MTSRPLDLLDLPTIYRYRGEAVSLDSTRLLTRGNPLGAAGFLSYFNPARHLYTAVNQENGTTLLGGILHTNGDTFAKLVYIAPSAQLSHPGLPALIEHLSAEAGKWGAFHVLAEIDETSEAFPALRIAGFSVYAWQRIWDVSHILPGTADAGWIETQSVDLPAIQSLYHQIVPPLLQPVEPTPKRAVGLVCADGLQVLCQRDLWRAGYCAYAAHPPRSHRCGGETLGPAWLTSPTGATAPSTCVCVPTRPGSNQRWRIWAASRSARQAVMVKHLARMVKDEQAVRRQSRRA